MNPLNRPFLLLITAQALHSAEEYRFRLYDALAPARYASGLLGFDRAAGFLVVNSLLVAFGLWCWWRWIRRGHRWAGPVALAWALLEVANGLVHVALAALAGGYFPGLATAPLLLASGGWLFVAVRRTGPSGELP